MDTTSYAGPFQEMLSEGRLNELGPGKPHEAAYSFLKNLTVHNAFAPNHVQDLGLAQACLAGLWLYHDYLEESHRLSQDLASAEGSYWHGIMHRREPDFGNAKYWFRRLGKHSIFPALRLEAATLAGQADVPEAAFLIEQRDWDPFAFVDLCEAVVVGRSTAGLLCRQIQHREWELLFDFCYRGAVGGSTLPT